MGLEGIENLTETSTSTSTSDSKVRETDQEEHDRKQRELDEDRAHHLQMTDGSRQERESLQKEIDDLTPQTAGPDRQS